jgi:uncharacterized protein (TIGR03067 family)
LVLLAVPGGLLSDPPDERLAARVAQLVKQLGHDDFAKREEASKELDAIGAPAVEALRKATAADDGEIRRRAEKILAAINDRARAAAAKAMQERLQGTWKCLALHSGGLKREADLTFTITGNTWETKLIGQKYQAGTFKIVDLDASPKQIDWLISFDAAGENKDATYHGIFMLDGDALCCVNSDAAVYPRPQVFFTEPNDGCFASMYKRVAAK